MKLIIGNYMGATEGTLYYFFIKFMLFLGEL